MHSGSSNPSLKLSEPPATGVDELVARHRPGLGLEGAFYTSEDLFQLDLRAIFTRSWLFVATEPEIPEPGDFVTVELGPYSVIVVRDDDENVTALHNVCRHRGSRIVDDQQGSVGNFVCPYHQWTYGVDGCLRHAESQPADFDRARFGLKRVNVRTVSGLIFICLADEPPADFDEVAETMTTYLTPFDLPNAKVAHQIDLVEEGNWKLVMENNRECYHCDGAHPELVTAYFPFFGYAAGDITPRLRPLYQKYQNARDDLAKAVDKQGFPAAEHYEPDTRVSGYRISHLPLDGDGASFAPGGVQLCRTLMGSIGDPAFGDLSIHLQPTSWFHFLSDHAVVFRVLPLSPGRSLLRTTWLVSPDAVEGQDYDVDALTAVWRSTNDQDHTLVARAQRGVTDPSYEPGPYSQVEGDTVAFVDWYLGRLTDHLTAR